ITAPGRARGRYSEGGTGEDQREGKKWTIASGWITGRRFHYRAHGQGGCGKVRGREKDYDWLRDDALMPPRDAHAAVGLLSDPVTKSAIDADLVCQEQGNADRNHRQRKEQVGPECSRAVRELRSKIGHPPSSSQIPGSKLKIVLALPRVCLEHVYHC